MVAIILSRVDLPAPSEPTSPKMLPFSTSRLTSLTASVCPKRMEAASTLIKALLEVGIRRHPCLQLECGIRERNLNQVDELHPLLLGLDDLGCELGLRGYVGYQA